MKFFIVSFAAAGLLLASCGPSKKLQSANSQIETLTSQVSGLNNQVASLNGKITDQEKQIGQLKKENIAYGKEAEDCRKVKEAISKRLDNLNKNLEEEGSSLKKINDNATEALAKFKDAGAEVKYNHGVVHITMQDKLLFASGSTTMSKEGIEALKLVADVLQENHKVKAIVVGNTDNTGISGKYKDNWSLSTERANSVVRLLRDKYGIDPARLTSAGRSKYNPVIENTTAANKAKNRRIDIIINPELGRLWDLSKE